MQVFHKGGFVLTPKHYTRLERPVNTKRSGLLGPFISYESHATFRGLWPYSQTILEWPARDKHTSLFGPFVSYEADITLRCQQPYSQTLD
jgi:hypothetical protein